MIAAAVMAASCSPSPLDVISLAGECSSTPLRYSDIVSRVRYTLLDAGGKARLGRILDIERTESYIFVISQGVEGVLQFDTEGHLLRRISLPESVAPASLATDNENRLLTVGCADAMHIYNFSGRHLRKVPLSGSRRWNLRGLASGYLCKIALPSVADNAVSYGYPLAEIINYGDSALNILTYRDTTPERVVKLDIPQLYGYGGAGTMEILSPVSDTIFAMDRKEIRPVATIYPSDAMRYLPGKGRQAHPSASESYRIESMRSTPSRIYLQVCHNDSLVVVSYDRSTGGVSRHKTQCRRDDYMADYRTFINDYDGGPGAWGSFPLSDGGYAAMIYPSDRESLHYDKELIATRSKELRDALAIGSDMPMVMFIDFK